MSVLMVPKDLTPFPSLGRQVCDFIEDYLVFGPGDLQGQPAVLDLEKRGLVYRMYEVYPKTHPNAGRRRFKRAALSLRKGSAKTEFAAWIAAAELHPEGPVRCDGFDASGEPVGRGVTDPYIPLIAYTEEQSDELMFGALRVILMYSQIAEDFDAGMERVMRIDGNGKAVSLAGSPDSTDGARTTFEAFDETHRFITAKLRGAHRTMLANIPKRKIADAWSLEVSTAFSPGENSTAENTYEYAKKVDSGEITDSRLFYFHRQAADGHTLKTPEDIRAAVMEASGPVAEWSDIDSICEQWRDPTSDKPYLERVYLNRPVQASEQAFDFEAWEKLARPDFVPPAGDVITLGFDGARWKDSVALVGTHLGTGYQWLVGLWERPPNVEEWEAPDEEIDAIVNLAFTQWTVWRMNCDPPYWETQVASWAGKYGDTKVVAWWTNRMKAMAYSIRSFDNAIHSGTLSHSGSKDLGRHIGNAIRKNLNIVDEDGKPLWVIYKRRADSPLKIDAAMASILSWEAYNTALAAGVFPSNDLSEAIMAPGWGM